MPIKEEEKSSVKVNIVHENYDFPFPMPENDPEAIESRNFFYSQLKNLPKVTILKRLYQYASLMMAGTVYPKNEKESMIFFKLAADLGNTKAMYHYAALTKNKEEEYKYIKMSCDKGDPRGMYFYGILLDEGINCAQDVNKAIEYFTMSAEKGNDSAMNKLGVAYQTGKGKPVDYYEAAAEKGNCEAYYNLGIMYRLGQGVPIDLKKSFDYFKKSADLGHAAAMNNLGPYTKKVMVFQLIMKRHSNTIIWEQKKAKKLHFVTLDACI